MYNGIIESQRVSIHGTKYLKKLTAKNLDLLVKTKDTKLNMATQSLHWQQQIGSQRDWFWRGWKVRYTYQRPAKVSESKNPPIILLHGFGASIGHWRYNIKPLSQNHTVYALDLLGFGASKKAVATGVESTRR